MKDPCKPYGQRKTFYTRVVYFFGSLLWIGLIFLLGLYPPTVWGYFLIFFPIFIFIIGFVNAPSMTLELEDQMFKVNFLSLGLIIVLSLFAWLTKDYSGNKKQFVTLLILAIIFALLAVVDVWVSRKWFSVVKHIKTVSQTLSISILMYALYLYWWHREDELENDFDPKYLLKIK